MIVYKVKYKNSYNDDYVVASGCAEVVKIIASHHPCLLIKKIKIIASDVLMRKADTTFEDELEVIGNIHQNKELLK